MNYVDNDTKTSTVIWNPIIPLNRMETLNGSSEEATLNYWQSPGSLLAELIAWTRVTTGIWQANCSNTFYGRSKVFWSTIDAIFYCWLCKCVQIEGPLEFFLTVSLNSANLVTKNICYYSKRDQTCHFLCKRPGWYHSASKTLVRDMIMLQWDRTGLK